MWFPWGSPHFCLLKMQPVLRKTLSLSNQLVTCTSAFFCHLSRYVYWKWKMSMALTKAVIKAPAIYHNILSDLLCSDQNRLYQAKLGVHLHAVHERMSSWHSGPNADEHYDDEVLGWPNTSKWWWWWWLCWGAWLSKHTKIHAQGKTNSGDDRLHTYRHYMHFWELGKETLF